MNKITQGELKTWGEAQLRRAREYRRILAERQGAAKGAPAGDILPGIVPSGTKRWTADPGQVRAELKRRADDLANWQAAQPAPDPALALADVLAFRNQLDAEEAEAESAVRTMLRTPMAEAL